MKQDTFQASGATRQRSWRWPVAALLAAIIAAGGWLISHPQASTPPKPAGQEEKKEEIFELGASDLGKIEARSLQLSLKVAGNLVPSAQATVKSKVSASVQQSFVQEGSVVQEGQVLAKLDAADANARLATQQAAVEEAQAKLSLAKKNSSNNQALLKQNYISQNAYDTAQNSVDLASANLKSAQAQLAIAKIAVDDTLIRAPFNGIISKRFLQNGDKASPDGPVFTIVNLAQMTLEAQVPNNDIARIKLGQDVQFQVDGFPGRKFHGKIERINPNADAGSRSLVAYAKVDNTDGSLKGGMYARGSVALDKSNPVPLLPLTALRTENGKDMVYKIDAGKIVAQPVKLGLRNEEDGVAEILEGLAPGSQILLTQMDNIKPGSKVKLPAAAKAAPAASKG